MSDHPSSTCAWCGGTLKAARRLCCSPECHDAWSATGRNASRRQIQRRLEHLAEQPEGCETIEAFLAAGGTVYRE
jgi:hypothetical protein